MRRIAVYGKGGIGKSTVTSNVSAAMAEAGLKVMQIGCDPKSDSTRFLMNGKRIPTVLDSMQNGSDEYVFRGYGGVMCVECGGPRPGSGCAGRGIIAAFEELEAKGCAERHRPDVMIYDVLGDVVCGGFAMPIRKGYARDVFIVTSGEEMSIYAARNIASAVHDLKASGYAKTSGVIQNSRGVDSEDTIVDRAAADICSDVIHRIPRDGEVQRCEARGMTVIEGAKHSAMADSFRELAQMMLRVSEDAEGGMRTI
jgi:nitrogenase iron protein NifH